MSLFNGPEYASCIEFMRELRLKRRFEEGDWLWKEEWFPEGDNDGIVGICAHYDGGLLRPGSMTDEKAIWLPRLDQWLTMLEEAGFHHVSFFRRPDDGHIHADAFSALFGEEYTPQKPQGANGHTREEAAGRLWCAVTGRVVTA